MQESCPSTHKSPLIQAEGYQWPLQDYSQQPEMQGKARSPKTSDSIVSFLKRNLPAHKVHQ